MTEASRAFAGEHGAMNNWDKIWKKRTAKIENRATVFEMFKELKRADGFDTQDVQGYYEAFFRQWECMALAEMEAECQNAELIASESCGQNIYVKFDKGTGIRQNFDRHTKEIKKAANYMRGKKKKNEFEQIALAAIDGFYREALAASELVQSKMFDERFDRMEQTNELIHGSYNYHNIFS